MTRLAVRAACRRQAVAARVQLDRLIEARRFAPLLNKPGRTACGLRDSCDRSRDIAGTLSGHSIAPREGCLALT